MRRTAAAAARLLGGTTVLLRLPSPPVAGAAEELGLGDPEFHDVAVGPCVLRSERDGSRHALVAAGTLEAALGVSEAEAARAALSTVALVQAGTESLLLRDVQALSIYGRAYLYRLVLRPAHAEVRA